MLNVKFPSVPYVKTKTVADMKDGDIFTLDNEPSAGLPKDMLILAVSDWQGGPVKFVRLNKNYPQCQTCRLVVLDGDEAVTTYTATMDLKKNS
jgi:hypothetical protein